MNALSSLLPLRIIWVAFVTAVAVVYPTVLVVAAQPGEELDPIVIGVFTMITLGDIGFIGFFRSQAFGPKLGIVAPDVLREPEQVTGEALEQAVLSVFPKYQTTTIVGLAISMSIAIFGLVLGFMAGNLVYYVPFAVIALVLIGIQFPHAGGIGCLLTSPQWRGLQHELDTRRGQA